jgi:hypothetical protein
MRNTDVKMVAKRAKQQAQCYVGTLLFWVFLSFLWTNFVFTSLAHADDLSRKMIEQLVVQHAHETRHVDAALALGVARVMSNFDATAVGPAQRIGIFQLDPKQLEMAYNKQELLDPLLNIEVGLKSLDQLIGANKGDVAIALVEFNNGNALGPWPMSRVIEYPSGFVANIYAARAIFERALRGARQPTATVIDPMLYATSLSDDIYTRYEPMSDLPLWRRKIATTRYWLGEVDRFQRSGEL